MKQSSSRLSLLMDSNLYLISYIFLILIRIFNRLLTIRHLLFAIRYSLVNGK